MSSGLRSLLRMYWLVRFAMQEQRRLPIKAATSGKHVFTTLHARDVAATITALRDLAIDNRSLPANASGSFLSG